MSDPADLVGWPVGSAMWLARYDDDAAQVLVQSGDQDTEREWASVTKLAAALGVARMVDRGAITYEEPDDTTGATLAHLLAHASGLGLEAGDPVRAVRERRIYSNVGIDRAVEMVRGPREASRWLRDEVFGPLGMTRSQLAGRPSATGHGPMADLARLALAWGTPHAISPAVRDTATTTFAASLAGVVPGFGRFDPCEWALGPEVHGVKHHWMGSRFSAASYGHFGQSGALVLVDPIAQVTLVAASGAAFGPWAQRVWPVWIDEVYERYVA